MLSTKQGSHLYHFFTPLVCRGQVLNPQPPDPEADALTLELPGPVINHYAPNFEKVGSILLSACPCVRPSISSKKI